MRRHVSFTLALGLILAGACAASAPRPGAPIPRAGLAIKLASVDVDDQDQALRFYTDVLGFAKHDDVSNGGYRWLTVTAPGDGDGTALLLSLAADPAAKAHQQARFAQHQPALMLFTDDVAADYQRLEARGAVFTMPPTEVMAGSIIATLDDTCGNLVQLTQLAHR